MSGIADEMHNLITELRRSTQVREETLQRLLEDSHRREDEQQELVDEAQKREDRYYDFACQATAAMTRVASTLDGVTLAIGQLRDAVTSSTAKSIDLAQLTAFVRVLGAIGIIILAMLLGADALGWVDILK
jgi:hypothetical protein